jgi:hypothetical protein
MARLVKVGEGMTPIKRVTEQRTDKISLLQRFRSALKVSGLLTTDYTRLPCSYGNDRSLYHLDDPDCQ